MQQLFQMPSKSIHLKLLEICMEPPRLIEAEVGIGGAFITIVVTKLCTLKSPPKPHGAPRSSGGHKVPSSAHARSGIASLPATSPARIDTLTVRRAAMRGREGEG